MAEIASLQVGEVAPLGPEGVPSGFVKRKVCGAVRVGSLGFEGDAQADLSAHGGLDKAIYGYAAAHYPVWAEEMPQHAAKLVPGGLGENLTIAGLTESDLCVGDVHAIGTALLQACQPRRPCFKLGLSFADDAMPAAFVKSARAGWYYRVVRPGRIAAGDAVALHDRPHPDFPFTRLIGIVNSKKADAAEWARMATLPGLAAQWREHARRMLARSA